MQMQKPTASMSKIIVFAALSTISILLFSVFMAAVASIRNDVARDNYEHTAAVYAGPVDQSAPTLYAQQLGEQVPLASTEGYVTIDAEFVKKGLSYQPTFTTVFSTQYVFEADGQAGPAEFSFEIPTYLTGQEISNLELLVNGEETKFKSDLSDSEYSYSEHLVWNGTIADKEEIEFTVLYETVGLSTFNYYGSDTTGAPQDFKMQVEINGTRSYNINSGLSVDSREFGDGNGANSVVLIWDKDNLYSTPQISVSVGNKLNPSTQVSRIYLTMAPAYVIFAAVIVFLSKRFGRGIRLLDFGIVTVLFTVFFPLVHYLSSFTIDPTMELFSSLPFVAEYSMPLYLAFGIAWLLTGGLMTYMAARLHGLGFALRFMLPVVALFIGFFPFVVTIPEYSMLLVLLGFVAFMAIVVQSRTKSI